jgi:multidrug efflux pump subunit AcrB
MKLFCDTFRIIQSMKLIEVRLDGDGRNRVEPTDVFSTLQVYLGSQYVNDFNYLGRSHEVVVQGDGAFRRTRQDISRLKARNTAGEMVPIGTVGGSE